MDTKSSVQELGRYVTQIFHYECGIILTFHGIDTKTMKQGHKLKLNLKDGRMLIVPDSKLILTEVIPEE